MNQTFINVSCDDLTCWHSQVAEEARAARLRILAEANGGVAPPQPPRKARIASKRTSRVRTAGSLSKDRIKSSSTAAGSSNSGHSERDDASGDDDRGLLDNDSSLRSDSIQEGDISNADYDDDDNADSNLASGSDMYSAVDNCDNVVAEADASESDTAGGVDVAKCVEETISAPGGDERTGAAGLEMAVFNPMLGGHYMEASERDDNEQQISIKGIKEQVTSAGIHAIMIDNSL
jgi:hypothetical protein